MNQTRFGTVRLCPKFTHNAIMSAKHGWIHWLVICFNTPYEYFDGEKMVKGKKNDCIIFPPHSPIAHGPDKDFGDYYEYNWIWIYGYGVTDLVEKLKFPLRKSFTMGDENCVTPFLLRIINEQKNNSFFSEQFISSIIYEMFVTLARTRMIAMSKLSSFKSIEATHAVIKSDYTKKLTLEQLAKISGYSVSRFSGLYKELYRTSPITDLLHTRIDAAKHLLISTDYSISRISELSGFESVHYFSSKFKELTGMSPKEYRAKNKSSLL